MTSKPTHCYAMWKYEKISRSRNCRFFSVLQVGLGMVGGGVISVLASFLYGTASGSVFFRNLLLIMCIACDTSLYIFCLFWKPTSDNLYMGLLVPIIFGFTDGIWSPLRDGRYLQLLCNSLLPVETLLWGIDQVVMSLIPPIEYWSPW